MDVTPSDGAFKNWLGSTQFGQTFVAAQYPFTLGSKNGVASSFNKTYTYAVRLHWVGIGPGEPAPRQVAVQLSTGSAGTWNSSSTYSTQGALSGTSGLTDAPVTPSTSGNRQSVGAGGKMLLNTDNSNGDTDIVLGPFTAHFTGTFTSSYAGGTYGGSTPSTPTMNGAISITASVSNYGLLISSDIQPSYRKETDWNNLPPQKDSKGADIPGTVDTTQINSATPAFASR